MKRVLSILSSALLFTSIFVYAGNDGEKDFSTNPLFVEFNNVINYNSLAPEHIVSAVEISLEAAKVSLKNIYEIEKSERTFDNTVLALDDIYDNIYRVYGSVYLMANVSPVEEIRNKANDGVSSFSKFFNELSLDIELYRSLKEYSETDEGKNLTGYKRKFLVESIEDFERDGLGLPVEKRNELKALQDKLSDLTIAFSKNIAEVSDFLLVEEKDMEGLDEDYKTNHKTEDGKYKIDLSYPSYVPFMKFATSESTRKELYKKYNNRASDKNLTLLTEILILRQQIAEMLGFSTFAEYGISDKMAKTPDAVWKFEKDLIDKVKLKARKDYNELLEIKKAALNDDNVSVIQPWEVSFYNDKLLKKKYQLDQTKVKEYFELNNVLDGFFKISNQLFDVEFKEVSDASVWNDDVRLFNVIQDGKIISRFYLDLHPRENKFSHAACFPMIKGKETVDGYQMPVASLVCNFPKATENQPALLLHSEVETFFHEFGHVLHNVLTKAEFSSMSGTSVSRDFVEAPSQIFENWTWNYEALKLFAKHYKTGEVLPEDLYEKMLAAKHVGSGLATLQQIFYGLIDMTLHDKYDPKGSTTTTEIVKQLQNEVTLYPYLEGTNMHASFGHLMGYAAGYYGYLWSKVYAEDMFSVFENNGIMSRETGLEYRDIILARGSSEDEINLVKEFLKRVPDQKAFLKSLGLKEGE
ncbi:MAG TPA: M3 family metallopeptidase [Ignavibacteriaceae bacterium]|nr:M3 family metallopeptidase [Ignavibacteriaceae bacterium]